MKTRLAVLACLAILPAGVAFADDDCVVPEANWQPQEAVTRMADEKGWTVRRIGRDDGCYEIKGRDRDGREIDAKVDPATLQVIELEVDDEAGHDGDRHDGDGQDGDGQDDSQHGRGETSGASGTPAPAAPASPPANGLFENGAPPQVQVN